MSRSSYTASERRGIIAIAIIALIFIGVGIWISIKGTREVKRMEEPVIVEMPEVIDSVNLEKKKEVKSKKKSDKAKTVGNKKKDAKKTYRRRSPLDEPV